MQFHLSRLRKSVIEWQEGKEGRIKWFIVTLTMLALIMKEK